MNIAIAGLGLIGGSFAKAIKDRTDYRVIGLNRSEGPLKAALECGTVDSVSPDEIGEADIVLIALYPESSLEFIRANLEKFRDGAVITDLCGIKRYICARAAELIRGRNLTFIGGHPMAGREVSGFESSVPTLYDGASMILTPDKGVLPGKLDIIKKLCLEVGFGKIMVTTPERHDEMIAFTSQLAHVVSSSYVQNPNSEGHTGFSAGSFSDMTRVASLNEHMWTELFLLNGDCLAEQIGALIRNLAAFKGFIEAGDAESLRAMLRNGREIKDRLNKAAEEAR